MFKVTVWPPDKIITKKVRGSRGLLGSPKSGQARQEASLSQGLSLQSQLEYCCGETWAPSEEMEGFSREDRNPLTC